MATTPLQKTPKKSSYFSYIKEVLNSQVPVKVKDYPILVQSPDCVSNAPMVCTLARCPWGILTGSNYPAMPTMGGIIKCQPYLTILYQRTKISF